MIACASILNVQAQNTSTPVLVDSNSKLIEFLSAASYNVKKIDSTNYVILVGNVQIRQGKTLMYGDSIVLNTKIFMEVGYSSYQPKEQYDIQQDTKIEVVFVEGKTIL